MDDDEGSPAGDEDVLIEDDDAPIEEEDEDVPIEETWKAMEKLVDEGLVKNIGVSNFEIDDLKAVQAVATKPIAMNQFETHP